MTAALPGALAAARPVAAIVSVIEVGNAARVALTPEEAGPLFGMTGEDFRRTFVHTGRVRYLVTRPGSRKPRYLVPVDALVELLAGSDGHATSHTG